MARTKNILLTIIGIVVLSRGSAPKVVPHHAWHCENNKKHCLPLDLEVNVEEG